MTLYLAGNEVDICSAFTGSVTADGNVALSGINRAGLRLDSWGQSADIPLPSALTEFWFHIRLYKFGFTFSGSGNDFLLLRNAEGQTILKFYGDRNSSTITATAVSGETFTFTLGTANIDVQCKIGASGGILRVYIDQVLVYEKLGAVQFASGTQSVANLQLVGISINTGFGIMFSQVVFSSLPTLLAKVYSLALTDGTENQWSGVTANVQGTDYTDLANGLKENVASEQFLFAAGNLPTLGATEYIDGVCLHASSLYEAGSAVTKVAPLLNNGTTTNAGADHSLTTSFAQKTWVYSTDPFVSGAWTASAVNALQFGLRAKA